MGIQNFMNKLLISYSGPNFIFILTDRVINVHKLYYNNLMYIYKIKTKYKINQSIPYAPHDF